MFEFNILTDITFEETKKKGARILATVMKLDTVSANGRQYKVEEGDKIAASLKGKPVYYGTTKEGKHLNPIACDEEVCQRQEPVGFIEVANVIGKKIKAVMRIFNKNLIEMLKKGVKYWFSVGGNAISETIKKIGKKVIHILHGARCNHLQIVDKGTPVGFPEAKLEKLIEVQETVMMCRSDSEDEWLPKKKKKRLVVIEETVEYEISGTGSFIIEL